MYQDDWETRAFVEAIDQGVKKIAEFLNQFGNSHLFFFLDTDCNCLQALLLA